LGPVRGAGVDLVAFGRSVALAAAFTAVLLLAGRRFIAAARARVERTAAAASGRVLSAVILLALIGAAVTQAIGLHAIFGGFVVGLTVGESSRITERTRVAIEDFVFNVFAPVFFASIGLHVDFAAAFDLRLVALVFVLADLAHEAGLLTDQIFVALVVMALATSLVSGPAMKRLLYSEEPDEDV